MALEKDIEAAIGALDSFITTMAREGINDRAALVAAYALTEIIERAVREVADGDEKVLAGLVTHQANGRFLGEHYYKDKVIALEGDEDHSGVVIMPKGGAA